MVDFIFNNQIIISLVIILISIITYSILKKLIKKVINFKKINKKKQETFTSFFINITRYLIMVIAFLIILETYGVDTGAIIASLGVVGLIAGLAVKDSLQDFVSGFEIVIDDTYNIGDWVTINNFKGEVISLGMRNTRLKSYEGDVLIINNGSITSIINHSISNINVLIDVKVSFDEDTIKIEKFLNDYCKKMNKTSKDQIGDFTLLGLDSIEDSFLIYKIVVEVKNGTQFEFKRNLLKSLKIELDKSNIRIPYDQMVIHERV